MIKCILHMDEMKQIILNLREALSSMAFFDSIWLNKIIIF